MKGRKKIKSRERTPGRDTGSKYKPDDLAGDVLRILQNPRTLGRLLALEKKRRKVAGDRLLFIGIHNIAQHWWCTQEAVFKSRANELGLFATYLYDRIMLAAKLGLVTALPQSDDAVLDVGSELDLGHAEEQFKKENRERPEARRSERSSTIVEIADDGVDPHETAFLRGEIHEALNAERYPRFRWQFAWNGYVVIGVPDGITERFVYEYKTTKNRFMLTFVRPVARAQGDLYAFFFRRKEKRIQIELREEGATETYEEDADEQRAQQTLAAFASVDRGAPARPPKEWKCRNCNYVRSCPVTEIR